METSGIKLSEIKSLNDRSLHFKHIPKFCHGFTEAWQCKCFSTAYKSINFISNI